MHPEDKKYSVDSTHSTDLVGSRRSTHPKHFDKPVSPDWKSRPGGTRFDTLSTIIFYLAILFFIIGFSFRDVMVGNWYQQFMPNIGGRTISDVYFLDSLTGWAVTPYRFQNDTSYVLKTTNSGNNWFIQHSRIGQFVGSSRVTFLNANTGYTAGVSNLPTYSSILKTTNGGNNWNNINSPTDPFTAEDMSIISTDTIWLVSLNSLTGGVFRTTNGGSSWQNQLNLGSQNPVKVYFFNGNTGYIAKNTGSAYIRKTTDSGLNWNPIFNKGFTDMFFIDSLEGWSAFDSVRKTTDGGLNWQTQVLPYGTYGGGFLNFSFINQFSFLNRDTIWGVGGRIAYPNTALKGLIYRTTNGGQSWQFQLPDTSLGNGQFLKLKFINRTFGWAYRGFDGIHTTTGGDPVWLTPVHQISSEVPKDFQLFQNYPNPFNPNTKIKFLVQKLSDVKLVVYDIQGRQITELINRKYGAGTYEADFSGNGHASGVYLYSLVIDGITVDTKKMLMIK